MPGKQVPPEGLQSRHGRAANSCRNEYLIRANIYARAGILTHALSALPTITGAVFSSVLVEIKSPNIYGHEDRQPVGGVAQMVRSVRPRRLWPGLYEARHGTVRRAGSTDTSMVLWSWVWVWR
jgi:hypothetical protein